MSTSRQPRKSKTPTGVLLILLPLRLLSLIIDGSDPLQEL